MTMIRLGYEIRTGRPVDIPLDHTAVTGRTQQSGKTTTLEALVHRSGKCAIVFVTKKAESGFRDATPILPYFEDSADWQFVASIMEALMGERMKFERSWIIQACKGADTLQEVHAAIQESLYGERNPNYNHKEKGKPRDKREWLRKPASGMNEGVLTSLNAYLDIVLPQISRMPYTETLELHAGLNVMDLSEYTTEMQSLVIRSVLRWVYENTRNTIVIIPEAWEFIPQNRKSPVLLAAEELIRKGAAAGNFVWIDSQDIAAVHKAVTRSIGVWILGVQQEQNEIKRMLAQIPKPTPSPTEIMQLGRGQFFACFRDQLRKVYVQPFWIEGAHAQAVALGEEKITSVEDIWNEKARSLKRLSGGRVAVREIGGDDSSLSAGAGDPDRRGNDRSAAPGGRTETDDEETLQQKDEQLRQYDLTPKGKAAHEEFMWKENYEAVQKENEELKAKILELGKIVASAAESKLPNPLGFTGEAPMRLGSSDPNAPTMLPLPPLEVRSVALDRENIGQIIELLRAQPEVIELLRTTPVLRQTIRRATLALDDSTLTGKVGRLVADGFFKSPRQAVQVHAELKRTGYSGPSTNVYASLKKLTESGALTMEGDAGYQIAPGLKIERVEA